MKKILLVTNYGPKEAPTFETKAKGVYVKKTSSKVKCVTFSHKEAASEITALVKKKKHDNVIFDDSLSVATIINIKNLIEHKMNGKSPGFIHVCSSKMLQIPTVQTHALAYGML